MWTDAIVWLATYLLHSTVLLGTAAVVSRLTRSRDRAVGEAVWKAALIGGILTTSLQLGLGVSPVTGSWSVPSTEAVEMSSVPARSAVVPVGRPAAKPLSTELGEPRAMAADSSASVLESEAEPHAATLRPDPAQVATTGLAASWGLGAAFFLLLLAISHLRLRIRLAHRRSIDEGPLRRTLDEILADEPQAGVVRLSATHRLEIPIAFGVFLPEICLPERALTDLTSEQMETLLAHEAAHLLRRDPFWLLVSRAIESIFFLQPLNRLAGRRLRALAEDSCDDWTVDRTGRPLALARCLTEVAGWHLNSSSRALTAPSMARGRSGLDRRVRRLLNRRYPVPPRGLPVWFAPVTAGAMALMVLLAPSATRADLEAPSAPEAPAEPAPPVEPAASISAAPAPAAPTLTPRAPLPPPAPPPTPAPSKPSQTWTARLSTTAEASVEDPESTTTTEPRVEEDFSVRTELYYEDLEDEVEEILDDMEETFDDIEEEIEAKLETLEDTLGESLEDLEKILESEIELSEENLDQRVDLLEDEIDEWVDRIDERFERRGASEREEDVFEESIDDFEERLDEDLDVLEDRLGEIEERLEGRLEDGFEEELELRLESLEQRFASKLAASEAELDRLEAEAERLAESGRLSHAEVERIRAESARIAREAHPTAEEMAALRKEMAAIAQELQFSSVDVDATRSELRTALEAWQRDYEGTLAELDAGFRKLQRKYD